MKKVFLAAALMWAGAVSAYEPRILDKNTRSLGMGGVGVSTYGYSFSPLANPAALGLMADSTLVPILDIGGGVSLDTFSLIKDLVEVGRGEKNFTDVNYDDYIGKAIPISVNSPLSLGFMSRGFGIWMNMGTEATASIFHNPDSLARGIKVNTIFQTFDQVNSIYTQNGGSFTAGDVASLEQVFTDGIYNDLINSGVSSAEAYQQANALIQEITGSTAAVINPDGSIDQTGFEAAWNNIQDGGGNLNIPEETLRKLLPRLNFRLYSDIAVNIGYGYKIPFRAMDNVSGLSFGATVRFIQRFKSSDALTNVDPNTLINGDTLQSSVWQAFSITSDFGVSLRLQNFVLSFAARDAFSTPFQWRGLLDNAVIFPSTSFLPSLDVGLSYRFLFKNKFLQEIGMYAEAVDLMNENTDFLHKMRLGLEMRLFRFLDLRVGMYDAFVTAGIGMGGKWGRVDFAYYRESYPIFKNYYVTGHQFSLNLSLALENTPERKAAALARKQEKDRRRQEQALFRDPALL